MFQHSSEVNLLPHELLLWNNEESIHWSNHLLQEKLNWSYRSQLKHRINYELIIAIKYEDTWLIGGIVRKNFKAKDFIILDF